MPTPHGSLALLGSLSAPLTVNLFYGSDALKSHFEVVYVVSIRRFCVLRAHGAREAGFYFMDQFILQRRLPYFNGP